MPAGPGAAPEFSRPLSLERLGGGEIRTRIEATARECAALATRFGLHALARLSASVRIERAGARDLIRVSGRLEAEVTQTCVVSLEPVHGRVDEDFTRLFSLAPRRPASPEIVVDPGEEDPPEPLGPEGLDLGEMAAQQLALALDPYPRKPGVAVPAKLSQDPRPEGDGPFAALKTLRDQP